MRSTLAFIATLVVTPVCADAIPTFDIDAACRRAAGDIADTWYGSGSLESRYSACMTSNQQNYDDIKDLIEGLTQEQQRACFIKWTLGSPRYYLKLRGCVIEAVRDRKRRDAEDAKLHAIPKQEFRY